MEEAQTIELTIGETEIPVLLYQKEGPLNIVYVHLHGDEPGARDAGVELVNGYGGKVISFLHGHERYITFEMRGEQYAFDPNRIFRGEGIEATLKRTDKYCSIGTYSPEAQAAVAQFAQQIICDFISDAKIIVALHNNSDGDYHASLYLEGEKFADDAEHVHIHDDIHHSDFFFVIEKQHHERLIELGFNSVLQSDDATEDGSLSMYCARNKLIYLNCEADEEHIPYQVTMLRGAYRLLIRDFAKEIKADDLSAAWKNALLSYSVQAGILETADHAIWKELEKYGLCYIWERHGKQPLYIRTVAGDRVYSELMG